MHQTVAARPVRKGGRFAMSVGVFVIGILAGGIQASPLANIEKLAESSASGNDLSIAMGQGLSMTFVWIPALDLWVGQYEVTNEQYNRYDMSHEYQPYYSHRLDEPVQPAVCVSWEDARNFCNWMTRRSKDQMPSGRVCRLPTEREWTGFATCGDGRIYPWGNAWPPPNGWNYRGEEGAGMLYRLFQKDACIQGHNDGFIVGCAVKKSGKNSWGLYGVGGNVWEWCQDGYNDDHITRVLKGGAWNNDEPRHLAVTNRSDALPNKNNQMIGFRVVVGPQP